MYGQEENVFSKRALARIQTSGMNMRIKKGFTSVSSEPQSSASSYRLLLLASCPPSSPFRYNFYRWSAIIRTRPRSLSSVAEFEKAPGNDVGLECLLLILNQLGWNGV